MIFTKLSSYFIPVIVLSIMVIAIRKKVNVFDEFTEGALEGLKMAFSIFPYLMAMIL